MGAGVVDSAAAVRIAGFFNDLYPDEIDEAMMKVLAVSKREQTRRVAEFVMNP